MSEPLICENERCMLPIKGPYINCVRYFGQDGLNATHILIVCSWPCLLEAAEQTELPAAAAVSMRSGER